MAHHAPNMQDEAAVRQWVEANPGRSLPLTVWLLDEKGADVNAFCMNEWTPLYMAGSLEIVIALMDRGADPTCLDDAGWTPVMRLTLFEGDVEIIEYLLQDARVRALVNLQDSPHGNTALHFACVWEIEANTVALVPLLLEAGASPLVANDHGEQPLDNLRKVHPSLHPTIALLERAIANAEKTSLLVKARRLVVISRNTIAPSYLQGRVAQAQPLPEVTLVPEAGGHDDENGEGRNFRTMLAFLLGLGSGPEGHGMPRDVFRVVLDLLMPSWDPLRYKCVDAERIRLLMLALAGKMPKLSYMTAAELRHWVLANPERVNERDVKGRTALFAAAAAHYRGSLQLTVWLLDEKGADVNGTTSEGSTALHEASSLDIVTALLDRGADPIRLTDDDGTSPLMRHAWIGKIEIVTRLLQDPRVRATINIQSNRGRTALHCVCESGNTSGGKQAALVTLLLRYRANYTRADANGKTPLALLRQSHYYLHYAPAIAILEQAPDTEKASLLFKARRLVVAADSNAVVSTYLQGRVARGQPLPHVALVPMAGVQDEGEREASEIRSMMGFLLGIGDGPEGKAVMPGRAFRLVTDLLMPSWDPLRKGVGV